MSVKNSLNGGQMIVDHLIQQGVPYAFGLCGHGNIGFIDALYERSDDVETISVRHESVAGFMADVYYRVSGQATATFTSCGPGSANMPICLGNAFMDSVPFFAVTGNVPTNQFNRGAFQELYRHYQADFPSTVKAYCKRVYQPTRGEQMPVTVREAWKTMMTGRPGPVVVDVPFDIFKEDTGAETPDPKAWTDNISCRAGGDMESIEKAARMPKNTRFLSLPQPPVSAQSPRNIRWHWVSSPATACIRPTMQHVRLMSFWRWVCASMTGHHQPGFPAIPSIFRRRS